jgi:hypothetical protein
MENPQTAALERLMAAAKRVAAQRGIPLAAAYAAVMQAAPGLYEDYLSERSAAGAPGSGVARRYTDKVGLLTSWERAGL